MDRKLSVKYFNTIVIVAQLISGSDNNNQYCPKNSFFIKSSQRCLINLKSIGNFTTNLNECKKRNATLLTVSDKHSFKELCSYFRRYMSQTSFAFFHALQEYNKKGQFNWLHNNKTFPDLPRKYWMDTTPEGLKCVELFSYKDFCRINDIVCWKLSPTICEYQSTNPCKINNGDCDDLCVPRSRDSRTCKCTYGLKFNQTKCVKFAKASDLIKCPSGYTHVRSPSLRAGNCFRAETKSMKYHVHFKRCSIDGGKPLTISNSKLKEATVMIRKLFPKTFLIQIWLYSTLVKFSGSNSSFVWEYDRKIAEVTSFCKGSFNSRPILGLFIFKKPCYNSYDFKTPLNGICQRKFEQSPCDINNGNCSQYCNVTDPDKIVVCTCDAGYEAVGGKCVKKCEVDNGGCHHVCQNIASGVTCSCKPGFRLIPEYNTECKYVDECQTNNGGCQHICKTHWNGSILCECRREYRLARDKKLCVSVKGSSDTVDDTEDNEKENENEQEKNLFGVVYNILKAVAIFIVVGCILIACVMKRRKVKRIASTPKRKKKRKASKDKISAIESNPPPPKKELGVEMAEIMTHMSIVESSVDPD